MSTKSPLENIALFDMDGTVAGRFRITMLIRRKQAPAQILVILANSWS